LWSASPPSDDLLRAIERAFARHQTSRELQNKQEFARARVRTLTPHEREVFDRIIRGRTNKQIGRALGATERTIKAHRHGVMAKIQVRSLPEFVSVAERIGVLDGASDSRQTAY
jgi:FixJ family two-component response regulator